MPTSSYFLPAIFLNPVVILHSLNSYFSYRDPSTISTSPHPYMEKFGPPGHSKPFFDVHANNNFTLTYTMIMVFAQILAYSKIAGNRILKKRKLRRDGKDVKHSRWSEPDEASNPDAAERKKERREMDEESRKKSEDSGVGGMESAQDGDMGRPVTRSQTRRQVRSIRSNQNRTVRQNQDAASKPDKKAEDRAEEDLNKEEVVEDDTSDKSSSETSDDIMIP